MSRVRDLVVVGGGPAGLALAALAARRGLDATVLEARAYPVDKACGEGVLPGGVRALERLGALPRLAPGEAAPVRRIRWLDAAGAEAVLALPAPGGLGIRRTALSAALAACARGAGAEVLEGARVDGHACEGDRIVATGAGASWPARLLVAADGLGSPVRRRAGLDLPVAGPARYGLRRHFAVAPWSDEVEVHFGDGAEAYVTPAGAARVGVAVLFERRGEPPRFEALLARFPPLAARLAGARPETPPRGAGPFARAASARTADRLALLGDAAGYLDAVTGEGISLALGCAEDLAAILPEALARGANRDALAPYERAWRRRWRAYAAWTRVVLALTRRPALRRRVVALAGARPAPFERLVAAAVG